MTLRFTLYILLLVSLTFVFFIDLFPMLDVYASRRLVLVWSLAVLLPLAFFHFLAKPSPVTGKGPQLALVGWTAFTVPAWVAWQMGGQDMFGYAELFLYVSYLGCVGLLGAWMAKSSNCSRGSVLIAVGLAICVIAYGLMSLPVYSFAIADNFSELGAVIPWGFVNMRYWSHLATWCLPLLPLAVLTGPLAQQRLWRTAVALGAAIWWWLLFLTMSRGSIVGLLVGAAVVAILFGRHAVLWLRVSIQFLSFGVVAWLILSIAIPSLVFDELHLRQVETGSSGRMPLWLEAWVMSSQNFPWGMGPQSWLTHEIMTPAYQKSPKYGHPHNMYLMWAAEYGWLAVLGLLMVAAGAVRKLWRRRAQLLQRPASESLPLVAFTASAVGAVTQAGVSAVFIAPASMIVGLFVLSGFWAEISTGVRIGGEYPVQREAFPLWVRLTVSCVLLVLCMMWITTVYSYYHSMKADFPYYQDVLREGAKPRFWFHGDFPRHPERMPDVTD